MLPARRGGQPHGTHLLHYALRSRLGKDVTQAGSSVRADKFRFDFAYHEPLGRERLSGDRGARQPDASWRTTRCATFTTSLEHAKDLGAMALFGEKYGDFVRVVEIDDFSRELCGGTHVGRTSEIGALQDPLRGSVGANVRRIEAVTGRKAVEYYRERDALVSEAAGALGAPSISCCPRCAKLQARVADLETEIKHLASKEAEDVVDDLSAAAGEHGGVHVAVGRVEARDMEQLVKLVDQVRDRLAPAVVALGAEVDGKSLLVVSVSKGVPADPRRRPCEGDEHRARRRRRRQPFAGARRGGDPAKLDEALVGLRRRVAELLEAGLGAWA